MVGADECTELCGPPKCGSLVETMRDKGQTPKNLLHSSDTNFSNISMCLMIGPTFHFRQLLSSTSFIIVYPELKLITLVRYDSSHPLTKYNPEPSPPPRATACIKMPWMATLKRKNVFNVCEKFCLEFPLHFSKIVTL